MKTPARIPLCCLPTPLHRLNRLSEEFGCDLWIKRDDLTGFAAGGNKGRKIEYLIAEAIEKGVDTIVCQGALQSNFIRQLGAACAMFGIACDAVVMKLPYYAAAGKPTGEKASEGGNVVLDELFGVRLHAIPDGDWDVLDDAAEALHQLRLREGRRSMKINIGGSSPLGAYAFFRAAEESLAQAGPFDVVVTPSSSGSTHAGLAYGFHGSDTRVIGISADPDPDDVLATDIVDLCTELDGMAGLAKAVRREDIDLRMDYCGEAYGIPSREGQAALERFARREGIILDPIYSGKAAAGLLDLLASGQIGGRVLFWHTGGLPTLFATRG